MDAWFVFLQVTQTVSRRADFLSGKVQVRTRPCLPRPWAVCAASNRCVRVRPAIGHVAVSLFSTEYFVMKPGTILFLGVASLCTFALAFTAVPRASGADSGEAAVKKHTADFVAAWTMHDPKAMAALWAEDGDLLDPWGHMGKGRTGVEKIFTDDQTGKGPLRDSTFELTGESVRFPTPDVAVDDWEVSISGSYGPDGSKQPAPMRFHCTSILKKVGGAWMIYAQRPYLTVAQTNASPAESESADHAMNVRFEDLKWDKIVPELGDKSSEIAILRVDPKTKATQLMIRVPQNTHVPKHWHTANETHTIVKGAFIIECEGKRQTLGHGSWNYVPSKMAHEAWTTPDEGALLFITADSAWDVNWVGGPPKPSDFIGGRKD